MTNAIKDKKKLKLFSFFFSFLIWIYVVSSAEIEADKLIKINYLLPNNYSIENNVPMDVSVNITGPRVLVKKYIEKKITIDFDIKRKFNKRQQIYNYTVSRKVIKLPLGLELGNVTNKNIVIRLARTQYKEVPIRIELTPKNLINPSFLEVDPPSLSVSGTKKNLAEINFVETKQIDAKLLKSSKELVTELNFKAKNIAINQRNAVVSYNPDLTASKFTFTSIPIIFQSTKMIESSSVKTVDVVVGSSLLTRDKLARERVRVFANTNGDKTVLKLVVDLPEGVELLDLKPDTVTVKYGN